MSGGPEEWNKEKVGGQTPNPESIKPESTEPEYKNLKNFSPDKIKNAIKSIDFGIKSTQKNEKLVSHLNKRAEGNNSIEGQLAQNEQIQLLLSELLSDYKNYIGTDKEILKLLIDQENTIIENGDQSKMIESMYEYMLTNDNEVGFENFIITNSVNLIKVYLSTHTNENGELSFISKNEIKARLKVDWFINLYKGYREKHTENSEALGKLELELKQFNNVASYVKNSIDQGIQQYLRGEYGKDGLAKYLNGFLGKAKENENLKRLLDGKNKDSILGVIRYGIKEYARLLNVSDKNPELKDTGDKVFDTQIRSYLYLYGIIVHPDQFTSEKGFDDKELGEILKSILITDKVIKDDGKNENKYLNSERNLQEEQTKQDVKRRKDTREKIYNIQHQKPKYDGMGLDQEKSESVDIQNATGVEIARERNLREGLREFKPKSEQSETDKRFMQKIALEKTGKQFILENKGILSNYFNNGAELTTFFILENNGGVVLNSIKRSEFVNSWSRDNPEADNSELKALHGVLLSFEYKFDENMNKLSEKFSNKKDDLHEMVKDYAIGAVIDNIKDMFKDIINSNNSGNFMNGFEFDENNAAKIENNSLIISGKFNGETLSLKYDLISGKLYMNEFINNNNGTIIIGNQEPNHEVGSLQSFEDILDDFYNNPTDSLNDDIFTKFANATIPQHKNSQQPTQQNNPPRKHINKMKMREKMQEEHKLKIQRICGTKLDEISGKIKDKIEAKSLREPVAMNLLRSFGIMPGVDSTKNISGGSDLYRVIQLIITSDNTKEDINNFSEYMKIFMNYIGLTRGENKSHQDKTGDIARIIFDKNNNQNTIKYVRNNTKNFDNDYSSANGKAQFDEKSNFGILKIIEENFTEGEYPNQKLSTKNINGFKNSLSRDISDVRDVAKAEDLISMDNLDKYYT